MNRLSLNPVSHNRRIPLQMMAAGVSSAVGVAEPA
jgi:hypothetical protein